MPFGSKIFDKQLDESQWWPTVTLSPVPRPLWPRSECLAAAAASICPFLAGRLADWLDPGKFYGHLHSAKHKTYKRFPLCFPPRCRVQSTLSSSKWDTDPAFWLVSAGLLLTELCEDVAARGFWELLLIWEFYFLTALFRDCRRRKAEALLCLISCTSIAQQVY